MSDEFTALTGCMRDPILFNCFLIVLNCFKLSLYFFRYSGSTDSSESNDLTEIRNWHDTWDDRDGHSFLAHSPFKSVEVAVIEEKLRYDKISSSHDLMTKIFPIRLLVRRFYVSFRITGNSDAERIGSSDECGELASILESFRMRCKGCLPNRRITSECDHIVDP